MEIPRLSAKEAEVLRLLLANGEMFGLEMVGRSSLLKRGTVYVTLSRMGEKGYVESRLENAAPGSGPPRRLYRTTALGRQVYGASVPRLTPSAAEDLVCRIVLSAQGKGTGDLLSLIGMAYLALTGLGSTAPELLDLPERLHRRIAGSGGVSWRGVDER
jgi:DNA-binding MarR family transcriptional regulator